MTKPFADRLRYLREKTGRTQEEIAEMLDIRRQTYSRYEQGDIMPKAENLVSMARVLNTTPNFLVGWEDEEGYPIASIAGGVLRRLREEKKLSLVEVAAEVNIPAETILAYEKGTREIPRDIIAAFARYFKADIDSIITLEMEAKRRHTIITTSPELGERYRKWNREVGYDHFTDSEIDEITSYAKYLKWKRNNLKGGGK